VRTVGHPLVRIVGAAAALLGVLAACLVLIGQPSSAGAGPLTLPNPAPSSAVRYDQPPLKVLLVGDSMAGSLGVGLGELATAYNVRLANAGMPGCSASMDGNIELTYFIDRPGWPCRLNHPQQLMATWQAWVDAFRPDVVVYLARSDLVNQQVHGKWTSVGHRDFSTWFAARLRQAVAVFTSHGAKVVLMTVPVSEQPTLRARPEDNPKRVRRDATMLFRVTAQYPGTVSVYNLTQLLTPGIVYRSSVDHVTLRCVDGVHLTPEAGVVVATDLYPRLWRVAGTSRVPGGGRWTLGTFPHSTPRWYTRLACS
jgi:hypothetical protein